MKILLVNVSLLVTTLSTGSLFAQDNFNEIVETHVDHIEEFIDKFNFDNGSQFYEYVNASYPNQKIDRPVVLDALFNKQKISTIPDSVRQEFIDYVSDPDRPVHLAIYDALWYATVPVIVAIDKEKIDMVVTLEIQMNSDYSVEWAIVGIKSAFLDKMKSPDGFYISASSHATYFPELYTALSSSTIFQSVVADSQKATNTERYLNLISGKEKIDVTIKTGIKYHFLQISGWLMTVEYVPQDFSFNTGWLISSVIPVNSFLIKRKYQNDVLGINGTQ